MQDLQSPSELLDLGLREIAKKKIFMRSGSLNPFGKVWSNITEVITKSICNVHWVRNFLVINLENRVGFGSQFRVI